MRPIGLAFKHTHKKYGPANQGEVMLIHRCTDCGKLSINRIAADDDTQGLLELFDTLNVIDVEIRMELRLQEIEPLSRDQFDRLRASLCGAVFSAD
jgi:hypothetical protein